MISKQDILFASSRQVSALAVASSFPRRALAEIKRVEGYALIIAGIRRCGKSTLTGQLMMQSATEKSKIFYINFDTPSMYGFSMADFRLIDEILTEGGFTELYFDEIQVVSGWELYIRKKLDEGYTVTVTGSNSSMLSRELGTKLTGRHITYELFPFSYAEYCGFKGLEQNAASLASYLNSGGFPMYDETGLDMVLNQLVNDILYRDIAVRYNLRDEQTLRSMLALLMANTGNLLSSTKTQQLLGMKSLTTFNEYLSFFKQSYLIETVPKFSYSQKVRIVNPKKVYCIDNGIVTAVSRSFSNNEGHKLENAVYNALRRSDAELFYFNESGWECDFIIAHNNIPERAIQVCYKLTPENSQREIAGLAAAMETLGLSSGEIITFDYSDHIIENGRDIYVRPFYEVWGE